MSLLVGRMGWSALGGARRARVSAGAAAATTAATASATTTTATAAARAASSSATLPPPLEEISAALLIVGSEVLSGAIADANTPWLARLLTARGVAHIEEIRIDLDSAARTAMMAVTGRRTVPQIFIGDTHVGGCDDLVDLDSRGALMPLLEAA